jgi:hypothetical protein
MTMAEATAAATTATAPATAPTNPATSTPAQTAAPPRPGVITDAAYDALPSSADRDRFARVKKAGDQGGSEWVDRAALEASSTTTAPAGDGTPAATVTADGRLQVGEMLLTESDIRSLIAEKAAADLRKTQVPATAEAYAAELPKEFKLPEGIEYKFDASAPAYIDARNWAHSQGLTQQQFSQLLSFHANTQIAEQQMVGRAAAAELAKLGANATARVTAIDTWLRGICGDEHGTALRRMLLTAGAVQAVEKIMTRMTSQGHASFRQDGREPASNGKGPPSSMSEAEYNSLSANEKFRISRLG